MPQLTQLPQIFWSQLFWLVVVFGLTFFVIGRMMLPNIQGTVDLRGKRIANDLERAQAARVAADQIEADWRARMDAARAEAAGMSQDARQESARETEVRVNAAAEKIGAKADAAEAKIRAASEAARGEIEAVAAEAARDMIQRLTGVKVAASEATSAVKAAMNG